MTQTQVSFSWMPCLAPWLPEGGPHIHLGLGTISHGSLPVPPPSSLVLPFEGTGRDVPKGAIGF